MVLVIRHMFAQKGRQPDRKAPGGYVPAAPRPPGYLPSGKMGVMKRTLDFTSR